MLDQLITRVGSTVGAKRIVGEEVATAMRGLSAAQRVGVELRTECAKSRIVLLQVQPVAGQVIAVGHQRTGPLRTAVRQEVRACYRTSASKPRNSMIEFDAVEQSPGATPPKVQRVARGPRPSPGRSAPQLAGL